MRVFVLVGIDVGSLFATVDAGSDYAIASSHNQYTEQGVERYADLHPIAM